MNSLLLYLLQSATGLLLFYGFYWLVLRRERSFRFNRFYLLLTPLLAFTLPLLRIPVVVPEPVAEVTWVYALPEYAPTVVVAAPEEEAFPWLTWPNALLLLYVAGALFFAFRLLRQLGFVRRLLQRHREQAFAWQECTVVPTRGQAPTFSFLRYIFWNDHPPVSEAEREQILTHERVHVVQGHSFDLLFLSILQILCWFNPLLLLYLRALADTHEYLADQQAVRESSVDRYAQLIVRQLFHDLNRPVFHPFASSKILNRIAMLKNPASAPKLWKQLLVLPVLAVSVTLFSFKFSPVLNESISATFSTEEAPEFKVETIQAAGQETAGLQSNQTRTFTGRLVDATTKEGVVNASVVAKRTTTGTSTDQSGRFTIRVPEGANTLVFSTIGYEDQEVELGASTNLQVELQKKVRSLGLSGRAAQATAQTRTISGTVTSAKTKAALAGATVVAKGAAIGAATDHSGAFSLQIPETVTTLIISNIGYATVAKELGESTVLEVELKEEIRNLSELKVSQGEDQQVDRVRQEGSQKQTTPYTWVEQMPTFKGGDAEMMKYLGKNIKYPEVARKAGTQGLVVLSFKVETNGTLSDIEVVKKLSPELDEEAVQVVKTMSGEWKPGMQEGKPVPVKFTLPIRFAIDQPANKTSDPAPTPASPPNKPFTWVEQMPVFEGGDAEMMKYLGQHIKYPTAAHKAGVNGLVVTEFTVEVDGTLSDMKVIKNLSPETDDEAVRVIKSMSGKWKPGRQNGIPVPVKFTLPIRFDIRQPANPAGTTIKGTTIKVTEEILPVKAPMDFLARNIRYPASAVKEGAEGLAKVEFELAANGTISKVQIIKVKGEQLHPDLAKEAERVIKASSGQWKELAQIIKVSSFVQPIRFTLKYAKESPASITRVSSENLREVRVQAHELVELVVVGYPPEGESRSVQMPSFRSGPDELNRHIRQRITFASPTSQRPVDGFVKISFVVNPDGTLSQVKLVDRKFKNIKVVGESSMNYMDAKEFDGGQRKLINDLSQQALEAVRATSGQWTPAQKNGRAEKSAFTVEIPIKYP